MMLRNYDSIMQQTTGGNPKPDGAYDTKWLAGCPGIVRDHTGSYYFTNRLYAQVTSLFGCNRNNIDNYTQPTRDWPVLLVGKNNADVSYNDYTLDYATGLSVVGYRGNVITYSAESCTYTMTKTFINNTAEDVTINEVGIFTPAMGEQANSSSSFYSYTLLCREKLTEPVTLAANGGKATFSLTVNIPLMNKPSA